MDGFFLRTPKEEWWNLVPREGLLLCLRRETCSGNENPSYLARRQEDPHCSICATIKFHPHAVEEKSRTTALPE